MISMAWFTAGIFALPQTIVYRVLEHPRVPGFMQCTEIGFFDGLFASSNLPVIGSNITTNATENMGLQTEAVPFAGSNSSNYQMENITTVAEHNGIITPETAQKLYGSIFIVAVYFVPLSVIIVTYAFILYKLFRKSRIERHYANTGSSNAPHSCSNQTETSPSIELHSVGGRGNCERPPTYLIRCLTLFRSTVKEEKELRQHQQHLHGNDPVPGNINETKNQEQQLHGEKNAKPKLACDSITAIVNHSGDTNSGKQLSAEVQTHTAVAAGYHNPSKPKSNGIKKATFDLPDLSDNEIAPWKEEIEQVGKQSAQMSSGWSFLRHIMRLKCRNKARRESSASSMGANTSTEVQRNRSVHCSSASKSNSANLVALRMCAIQVLAFLICWTPFVLIQLWYIIGKYTFIQSISHACA